ncbi:hypothetical protein HMPREF0663_10212 [Hoylesella oralis ATCC 33269]|uniref:Uncharacterized protein n=1 Tax=Hoylesella oralis ATCC 33269 TaxID=873533 RepID=E7RM62_9BACT|nr:hypothetical protein HMPREF0663_10212 [Hoylesella oralis ATCC 33269]
MEDIYFLFIFVGRLNYRLGKNLCIRTLMKHALYTLYLFKAALMFG